MIEQTYTQELHAVLDSAELSATGVLVNYLLKTAVQRKDMLHLSGLCTYIFRFQYLIRKIQNI